MQDITPPNRDDRTKLEKVQDNLYSPSKYAGLKPRKDLKPKGYAANESWDDGDLNTMISEYKPKKRLNWFIVFAVIAFLFFIGAAVYGFFNFLNGTSNVAGNDVDINVIGPVSIGGGEELTLDIVVQNSNAGVIQTVDLVIEYPDGTKQADDLRTDLPRIREGLGNLEPGTVVKRTYAAALFGEEGEDKEIIVSVEYRLPESNAIFEKKKTFDVVLQSSPIRLLVDNVKEVNAGQELVFDVSVSSNSNQILQNVMLEAVYPFGFEVESTTRDPYTGDNKWFFEVLKPKETQRFQIRGRLLGQDKEERVFKFTTGIRDEEVKDNIGIVFTTIPKSVTISRPFFDVRLSLDGNTDGEVVKQGNQLVQAELRYANNTNSNISNAKVVLSFNGDVLDKNSVRVSDGFYRSTDNTILWDKSTKGDLTEIQAGDTGVLAFTFQTKPLASGSTVFKNPEITMNITSSGLRTSETEVQEEVQSTSFSRVRFVSDIDLQAFSTRLSSDSGPIPPKVDQETTYTIDLELDNTSNNLSNGVLTASLPNYVKWKNIVTGGGETINYDPISRIIEWKLGDVSAFAGYTLPTRKVSFQVGLTPSASQIGGAPVLVSNVRFAALDTFIDRNIETVAEDVTTELYGNSANETSQVVE
ncbi:hypothetical protein H6775_02440 [Candidatus Nomurabacteria bacterium]|nr:hypothetical protein [Candidatus Nomurabacteria bacterium]